MMGSATLLLVVLALAACSAMSARTLDGTEWLSVRRTDAGKDWPLVEGTRIRLRFDDGSANATAGCNTIGGAYRVEDGRLILGDLSMTEVGCDEPRHAQDEWLGGLLGAQPNVTVTGTELTLSAGDVVVAFESRELAEPDLPFIGTTWTVESLISGDAVSSAPGGAVATLTFADDGSFTIETGCNSGGGRYVLDGNALTVRDAFTTLIDCGGAAGQLEGAVLGVLGADAIEVTIESSTLTLMAGDEGLGLLGD